MTKRAFDFLHLNRREGKPREKGITEIRGPYYDPMGPRGLRDILETMGEYVDIYKFSGGSFALMPSIRTNTWLASAPRTRTCVCYPVVPTWLTK